MARPSAQLIRELRQKKGLTTHQLAQRAGIAERTLRNLEHGDTENPHPETIAALAGALGVEPEELFETPTTRHRAAAWTAGATAVLVVVGLVAWWLSRPAELSIAVLPLEDLSGDPEQQYIASGLQQALISSLARVGLELRLVSRTSAIQSEATPKSIAEIARELDVDWLIEGSIQREGDLVLVCVQLVDARRDSGIWSNCYEKEFGSALVLQREIAHEVARRVQVALAPDDGLLASAGPVDPEALDAYLRATAPRYDGGFPSVSTPPAIGLLEQAVVRDPQFAQAWGMLALARGRLGCCGFNSAFWGELSKAEEAARRALELDDRLSSGHLGLCMVRLFSDWDFADARRACERAVQLSPSDPTALAFYARYLVMVGRADESVDVLEHLLRVAPGSLIARGEAANGFSLARRYERALEEADRVREVFPEFGNLVLSLAYTRLGRLEAGHRVYMSTLAQCGSSCDWWREAVERGWADGGLQGRDRAVAEASTKQKGYSPFLTALWYAAAGDTDDAFAELERAYRERDPLLVNLKQHPSFDPVRSDPRFADLLDRIGFPES